MKTDITSHTETVSNTQEKYKNFHEARILLEARTDKYDSDVKLAFMVTSKTDAFKGKIRFEQMLELAEQEMLETPLTLLLRNGYKASSENTGQVIPIPML